MFLKPAVGVLVWMISFTLFTNSLVAYEAGKQRKQAEELINQTKSALTFSRTERDVEIKDEDLVVKQEPVTENEKEYKVLPRSQEPEEYEEDEDD